MAARTARATAPKVITQDGERVASMDLDALEHEATEEPFTFTLGGQVYELHNPEDVDWQDNSELAEANENDLRPLVRMLLGEEQYAGFAENRVPLWKLGKLIDGYYEHHGLGPGESKASSRSAKNTKRR